jgi:hypothetical protein
MTPRSDYLNRSPFIRPSASYAGKSGLLYGVLVFWGILFVVGVSFAWLTGVFADSTGYFYLLPWCILTGITLASPIVYSIYKQNFDPFNPVIFASWSFFLPGFFIGGITLALGLSRPYFLAYVIDEQYNLPLTFVYVILGFLGLWVGFAMPVGKKIGNAIGNRMPEWNWTPQQILKPALILLVFGLANTAIGFTFGFLGYQKGEEIGTYDGFIFLLSLFWLEATFLLWLYIFRSKKFNSTQYLVLISLIATSFAKSAFQGNRGSLVTLFTVVACAYVCSGKQIGLKQSFVGGMIIIVALVVGMIYGTTFRSVKGNHDQMRIDEYAGVIGDTFSTISSQDMGANLGRAFGALADRLDSISPLAVIVSNYETLAPYEEAYGMADNIWNETVTFLIPRMIWVDKPVTIDPSKYGDLYFNFADNSFTMTPMGDLLRNFGPWGVPLGMIVLGFFLRIAYTACRENRPFSFWRSTMFFMLLTAVSYEGSYGLIIPYMAKIMVFAFLGIVILRIFAGRGIQSSTQEASVA